MSLPAERNYHWNEEGVCHMRFLCESCGKLKGGKTMSNGARAA